MKLLPFALTPAGMGLKGKDRDKAEAYYKLQGEELQRRLCDIDFEEDTPEHKRRSKEIDIEFDSFENEEEKEYAKLELKHVDDPLSDAFRKDEADLDLKYGKIEKIEHDKIIATLNNEPWVGYKDYNLEENEDGRTGFWFDFDWNDHFIAQLIKEGYKGADEDEIVRKWYAELCRTIALEEGLALDLFGEEGEEVEAQTVAKAAVNKKKLDDEHTEYS